MLDHLLTMGGLEIVNSARAYGYATTSDCPIEWLQDPECGTIEDAQDDVAYTADNITSAPWYDPDQDDLARRFLGLYGIDILNLSDSTRTATVIERNDDGAVVGGYRHASREVRVRGWMTAAGLDALEYGMTWLRNALEPNACGMHGDACGATDAQFLVDCPPPRRMITAYTPWVTLAVNRVLNPIADASWTQNYGTGGVGSASIVPGKDGAPAQRMTWTTAPTGGQAGIVIASSTTLDVPVTVGEQVPIAIDVASSGPSVYVQYSFLDASHSVISSNVSDPFVGVSNSIPNPTRITFQTLTVPAGTAFISLNLFATRAEITNGAWISGSRALAGTSPLEYFDGSMAGDDLTDFSWSGPANAAPSIMATRTSYEEPESDASYFEFVDGYRRNLHSVRCISGPFVVQEVRSVDKIHIGRLVEFTLNAGVPYVYGVPKVLDSQPVTPFVIQDVAYNLAPYPSAELPGVAMIAATNYVTNPSLETDASGWVSGSSGSPAAVPSPVGVRSTDVAAVGAASYKVSTTTTNSGGSAAGMNMVAYRDTPLSGSAGTRYSFSVWGFLASTGAAAVLSRIDAIYEFRDSGGTLLASTVFGTVPPSGGAMSLSSILPPATAVSVRIILRGYVTSWSVGSILSLYADAMSVTVP